MTSHQASIQVIRVVPAAIVANAIFQQTCPEKKQEEYLKIYTVVAQLTVPGEVSFHDTGLHVYFVTDIVSNLFNLWVNADLSNMLF